MTMFEGNDVYVANGYDSREDYLNCLAEEYGVDLEYVEAIADIFGPTEDFDGLVTAIQDYVAY